MKTTFSSAFFLMKSILFWFIFQWILFLIVQLTRRQHWFRDHFVYAPSQWETTLQCNVVSHWMGPYTKLSLLVLVIMVTSLNGNIFLITNHLCGELTGPRWIPRTTASDAELWFFSLICIWINGWVKNREAGYLRRYRAHYDVTVMVLEPNRQKAIIWTNDDQDLWHHMALLGHNELIECCITLTFRHAYYKVQMKKIIKLNDDWA